MITASLSVQHQRVSDLRDRHEVGSSPTASAPLFVWMHGGGIGYFDATGKPQPDTQQMTEQAANTLQGGLTNAGLLTSIRNDPVGFRVLAVSCCDRDLSTVDPRYMPKCVR